MMHTLRNLTLIGLTLLSNACSLLEPALDKHTRVEPGFSYAYGDFAVNGKNKRNTIALILEDVDKHPTYLGFYGDGHPTTYAVKLKPGAYTFGEVAYLFGEKEHNRTRLNTAAPRVTLNLEANKAYYLGDYQGQVKDKEELIEHSFYWKLTGFEDRYETTTARFRQQYTQFADIETVNLINTFTEKVDNKMRDDVITLYALIKKNEYEKTYTLAQTLAEKSNPVAMQVLANMYEHGVHVEQSTAEAAYWYRRAANHELPTAMTYLGILLLKNAADGNPDPKRKAISRTYGGTGEGIKWLERAGVRSEKNAMAFLCLSGADLDASVYFRILGLAWCNIVPEFLSPDEITQKESIKAAQARIKNSLRPEELVSAKDLQRQYRAEITTRK